MRRSWIAALVLLVVAAEGVAAQTPSLLSMPADAGPVAADVGDSQVFFRDALKHTDRSRENADKVEALLKQMTVEEKVGQMTQLTIDMISTGYGPQLKVDPAKLKAALVDHNVGAILNVNGSAFTVDQWQEIQRQIQEAAQQTRLKIPIIYGIDSIHGVTYVRGSTLFPQSIGMAATWNPEIAKRAAEVTAMETRACGIPWNFSPVLDLGRQPLWPRFYETYGEDPYLATVLGAAVVRGYQGDDIAAKDHVAACLKHYMGYSFPLSGRDRTSAWIPENYLREYFLPTFQAAVAAGAESVMVNSGEINGLPVHADHHILTDILRGELGFKGVTDSDWQDIEKLVTTHEVAATERDAARMSVNAGVDMSMVPLDYRFYDDMVALAKSGAVSQSRLDEAVRRILKMKYDLGLFDNPMPDPALKSKIGMPESRQVALQAARESITLLKNDGNLLPLAAGRKVLVTGPTADTLVSLNNGWSYTWQGDDPEPYPKDRLTILGAIRAKAGVDNVAYVPGAALDKEIDINAAVDAAKNADVAVVCIGEGAYAETPGNIDDLTLPEPQLKLAEAIEATGKPVVLVLVEGRPRVINRIVGRAGAILTAYNPGHEGGQAIAEVLWGEVNPSGKLPFTYPRDPNALLNYDHKIWEGGDTSFGSSAFMPQWEFGYGLSYTTFVYSDLKLSDKTIGQDGKLTVSVTVKNTGSRAGKEVVQLYVRDVVASLTPPGKRLKRFAKVALDPGQSRTLTFTLDRDDLTFIGLDNKPVAEPGDFEVMVAGLKDKFTLR
jgi:beta-glucosidase